MTSYRDVIGDGLIHSGACCTQCQCQCQKRIYIAHYRSKPLMRIQRMHGFTAHTFVIKLSANPITIKVTGSFTRKPCYRKDDRAMRPIYGCPKKFRESSQTPPASFPEICKGFLFRSILRMCIQNLKFVALSVPEIIGATQKIWAVPGYAHAPFSHKISKGFCSDGSSEYICQI